MIENWNSANDFILFGTGGEIATNRQEDQELMMLALHLLQNSLVFINTLIMQRVLREAAWEKRLTAEDLRGLTPLMYSHISPYGTFLLDMHTRLDLERPVAAVHPMHKHSAAQEIHRNKRPPSRARAMIARPAMKPTRPPP